MKPEIEKILSAPTESGEISESEAKQMVDRQSNLRPFASEKAEAFLYGHGIIGISQQWLSRCTYLRANIVHGRFADTDYGEIHARTMVLRELVICYIMHLIGYTPRR